MQSMGDQGLGSGVDVPGIDGMTTILTHRTDLDPGSPLRDRLWKQDLDRVVAASFGPDLCLHHLKVDPDLNRAGVGVGRS